MITAVFTDGDDCVWAYGLWQWDYGQQLRIEGLHLPTVVEIHFSLQEAGGEAVPRVGVTKDGVTTVTIPDSMLEGAGAVRDYQVYAWVYLSDRTFGETTKQIMMKVKARSITNTTSWRRFHLITSSVCLRKCFILPGVFSQRL